MMRQRDLFSSLRRRADFSRVHARGRRKGDGLLQVRVLLRLPARAPLVQTPLRVGILVGKKYGSAVERNRFKRLVRAALRDLGTTFTPNWDILILPRQAHEASMQDVRNSLRHLLGDLDVLKDDADASQGGED
ncbi:MAG TPA: ribonuclease P protein component [Armatimonadota bacterium]|jgi:ribonuclease P protein component